MNLRPFILLLLAVGTARVSAADAVTTAPERGRKNRSQGTAPAPARTDASAASSGAAFDSFALISDRNIFNPNRTGRRDRSNEDRAPRLDAISLVGTMETDRGLRAFFDGSATSYRKALRVGESVDKFKVTQIAPNVVDLECDGKTMAMRVGQQLRRPDGGDWNIISLEVVRSEAAAAAAKAGEGKIDPTAQVVIPANADPVLRALMEKRNKDLKK